MSICWSIRVESFAGLETARAEGFMSVQVPVATVMDMDTGAFLAGRARLKALGISTEVFEAPLPKGVQVTEPGFNTYHWSEYLGTAMRRISELGCTTLVWGDGRARLLPVEGDISTAREHFYQFMFILCEMAERFGITVCLEPLGSQRTNFLNSLDDLESCFPLIDKRNLAMMVSPRDLAELGVQPAELSRYRSRIVHVQVEHPEVKETSVAPSASDGYDYAPFFRALRQIGYSGAVALPSGSVSASLAYCRDLWEKAGSGT